MILYANNEDPDQCARLRGLIKLLVVKLTIRCFRHHKILLAQETLWTHRSYGLL